MTRRTELVDSICTERQITFDAEPHVLTNVNAFSPDSSWIVYDRRSNGGENFDGQRIECVNVATGEVRVVHEAVDGANVGVATFDPSCNAARDRIVFIEGPRHPTADFHYSMTRRHGRVVDFNSLQSAVLDARDLVPPFTPGALRGGSHVHVFSFDGSRVSFTYEDDVLDQLGRSGSHELNQRTIAVSQLGSPVTVSRAHPHNHDGIAYSVVVVETTDSPTPGSDEISRAVEESWIGRSQDALAFQGTVKLADGRSIREVFVVELAEDLRKDATNVAGTPSARPRPPSGCRQCRITFTQGRKFPGIDGPRHWLRSAPDGSAIAYLARDDDGVVQLWLVSPSGDEPRCLTNNAEPIASAFTWSPDGKFIAHVIDDSVAVTNVSSGQTFRLTAPASSDCGAISGRACVFSPDGKRIAFMRGIGSTENPVDQICVVDFVMPTNCF